MYIPGMHYADQRKYGMVGPTAGLRDIPVRIPCDYAYELVSVFYVLFTQVYLFFYCDYLS